MCSSLNRALARRRVFAKASLWLVALFFVVLPALAWDVPSTFEFPPASGPIDDATCNIEDLERANDSQLYSILHDLTQTQFFRTLVMDLEHKCPLRSFQSPKELDEGGADFECTGGKEELDPDALPLCGIDTGDVFNPFALDSNALKSLSQDGFQSKEQKETYTWSQHVDMVVTDEKDCPELLPELFWMDLCSNIQAGDGTKDVNLALNPERNTGYNGTHIWRAIYEENCISLDDNDDDMCLEERVLYRLLSGLHASTTISIAMNYYPPSKRKNRVEWQANPQYFMEKFANSPDYIRNLHFSYVVLLRALRKASPYLHQYEIRTGNIVEDETARVLLKRLLDSAILQSCSSVFDAFDEGIMFQEGHDKISLQQSFKGVFHNVSSILDCVQCQQCKLHGKMAMLGYGTALKTLFVKPELLDLERNEIVALVNTIAKLSESMRHVRELTAMYWKEQRSRSPQAAPLNEPSVFGKEKPDLVPRDGQPHDYVSLDLVDAAVGLAAALGRENRISFEREAELVKLSLDRHPELLILAKHYGHDLRKFEELSKSIGSISPLSREPDAIVVGSGLAGLAASLNILDRGGRVIILEKEHLLGGNSNKASSGINAWIPDSEEGDSLETFRNDTTRSAGSSARTELIETLITKSGQAVEWLRTRVGVDLSLKSQLGGHSVKRTHRPSNGMAGAEIIFGMQKAVKAFIESGQVQILVDAKVMRLLTDDNGAVTGVEYVKDGQESEPTRLYAPHTILATGGFAADRSAGSYLDNYRPELLKMATTAGAFSTGDGVKLATALGAGVVDMDKVQVHPTGWVDPVDPENTSKTLAAELMRGVGGILVNEKGERFCNELGTRAYVTDAMLSHNPNYAQTRKWDSEAIVPTFSLVLSSSAASDGQKHVDLYSHKGLMTRVEGLSELARFMKVPESTITATLQNYRKSAANGVDEFGKASFRGLPSMDLERETFYVGKVTPVLHYCMGGITIDKEGSVLTADGVPIRGLHAAGEVSGGVHGVNRLAGNSLLECTVFGTIVGLKIPVGFQAAPPDKPIIKEAKEFREITIDELSVHNTPDDCWVAVHGLVYDLTDFANEHPGGPQSIHDLAGTNGTLAFASVHNAGLLEDFDDTVVGRFQGTSQFRMTGRMPDATSVS